MSFYLLRALPFVTTIIICPGPLVHRMDKMSWRNDYGGEGLILAKLCPAASAMIPGRNNVLLVKSLPNILAGKKFSH
jgi:hypothetical protein